MDPEPVVAIDLPDGYPVVARARVVSVDVTGSGWEYRLAFPGIADDDRARLLRLTRRRRPPGPVPRHDLGLQRDFCVVDGVVESIFVAGASGQPMRAVDEVQALAGGGLAGDRYCTGRGYWTDGDGCQVTIIEGEDLDYIAAEHGVPVANGRHRRNLVTRGVDLTDLEGRRFTIGDAIFEFDQPRPPCRYIASLTEAGMTRVLGGRRGGIGVRVLRSGAIRAGDRIELQDEVPPRLQALTC